MKPWTKKELFFKMDLFLDKLKKALEEERRAEVEKMEQEMCSISGEEREKRGRAV